MVAVKRTRISSRSSAGLVVDSMNTSTRTTNFNMDRHIDNSKLQSPRPRREQKRKQSISIGHKHLLRVCFVFVSLMAIFIYVVVWKTGTSTRSGNVESRNDINTKSGTGKGSDAAEDSDSHSSSTTIDSILAATSHLVTIHVNKIVTNNRVSPTYYDGIEAEFCQLDWNLYKQNPSSVPKYRDLWNKSDSCRGHHKLVVNLRELMERIYDHDDHHNKMHSVPNEENEDTSSIVHVLDPYFIFHEGYAGSTLVANALAHFDHDPTSKTIHSRVYAEAGPPLTALKICGENYEHCSREVTMQVFKDVMYIMRRVPAQVNIPVSGSMSIPIPPSPLIPERRHVFFKMQPTATTSIDIVQDTFPTSPWVFLYRDPEEVLVSQLLTIRHMERAKCLMTKPKSGSKLSRNHPHPLPHHVQAILDKSLLNVHDVSNEEYCAIFLSTICNCAIDALQSPKNKNTRTRGGISSDLDVDMDMDIDIDIGRAYNYEGILDKLIDDILPNHFNIPLSHEEIFRIRSVGKFYSKERTRTSTHTEGEIKHWFWLEDSEKKHDLATSAVHQASNDYLAFPYVLLENLAHRGE